MNFTQELVSKLGTKPEPFGWSGGLTLLIILLFCLVVAGLEFLLGQAMRRIAARAWQSIRTEFDRANRKGRDDR